MPTPRSGRDDAVRITSAGTPRAEERAGRQRRYLISMLIRSACFVGAVIAGLAGIDWLWPILIGGAVVLPYVAVVLANASNDRTDDTGLVGATSTRPELEGH